MSSKPSLEGAAELATIIRELRTASDTLNDQRQALARATARIRELEELVGRKTEAMDALFDKMDCSADGNFGFAARRSWLMVELVRQLDASKGPYGESNE